MRRHIHRAKAFVSSLLTVRHLFYFVAALLAGVIVAAPIYIFFFQPQQTNQLEEAIKSLRFHPITPPTTLRAPGTIYVIDGDGEVESVLCWADANELKDILHESPTESKDAQSLRKATFDSSAKITESLKEQVKGDVIESVSFSLQKVSVLEVSIGDLRVLASTLQKNPKCGDSVFEYLKAGQRLCQGQQVLKATTHYSIQTKREVVGEIAAKLNDAIRATIDPKASFDGKTVTAGEALFYGMRLAPLCMALDDKGVAPPPKPRTFWTRMLNRIGL